MSLTLLNDLRRMIRDQFIVGLLVFVVAMSVGLRFALPALDELLQGRSGLVLSEYFPLFASYLATSTGAVMAGLILGILLIENREQDTLSALRVSPLPLGRLLMIEGIFAWTVSVVLTLVSVTITGIGLPALHELVLFALACSLFAPLIMLTIASFCANKLEAFALLKILNILVIGPMVAFFVPEPWQYFAAIFPPYGIMKAWWIACSGGGFGDYWHWLLIGVVVQVAGLVWLRARYLATVSR